MTKVRTGPDCASIGLAQDAFAGVKHSSTFSRLAQRRIAGVLFAARLSMMTNSRSDRISLIADAFEAAHEHAVPSVEGLTAREGLQRLLRHVAEVVADSSFSSCIPALIEGAERDPRLREFRHRYSALRRQSLTSLITRGVAEGEFRAAVDPELAAQALLGPIFYCRLMTSEPLDPRRADDLIDTVLGP